MESVHPEIQWVELYRMLFKTPEGEMVLKDLAEFCGDKTDLFVEENSRKTDYLLGRRSVYLFIQERMKE